MRVFLRAQCAWGDGKPATLSAELHIAHHDGAAPEPNASATPPRSARGGRAPIRALDGQRF